MTPDSIDVVFVIIKALVGYLFAVIFFFYLRSRAKLLQKISSSVWILVWVALFILLVFFLGIFVLDTLV